MSTITLADLLVPQDESAIAATLLGALSSAGFPTTSWASTSVATGFVNSSARALEDVFALIPKIAAGGLVSKSSGGYLTLLAESNYLEKRDGATFAVRSFRLTDSTGSPTPLTAGQVIVQSADGRFYRNIDAGTVPASSTLDLEFRAEGTGTEYNADAGPWTLSTPLPGISISHLALVTAAVDEESDASLKRKCVTKWSTLGAGANDDAYEYHATHTPGVTEVVRVKVRRHTPAPGQVTIILAGATGTVSGATVSAVQDYIDPPSHLGKAPNCVDVIVEAAVEVPLVPVATVYRKPGFAAAIEAEHSTTIPAIAADTEIGGTAYRAEFIERLMAPEGVVNVVLTTPAADVALAVNEVLTISSMTITYVDA